MLPGEPPAGSCFRIAPREDGAYTIAWLSPQIPRAERWSGAGFLVFCLCFWLAGEVTAALPLLNIFFGVPLPAGWFGVLFLTSWFGSWTIGGLVVMAALLDGLLRPPRPESVTLRLNELIYDPGRAPPAADPAKDKASADGPGVPWRSARVRTIPREGLGPIRLERVGERQRLTIDVGAERVEVGRLLREPEREWLAETLRAWAGQA